jgi:hypothetical protein
MDSNFRFRASGDTPQRPRGEAASHRSHPPKDPPPEQSSLLDSNRGPALVLEYAPLG